MTIKTVYQGDLHTTCTHVQSGSILHTDAPTDNHGRGENFSPTDLLATAAGTCAITFLAIHARKDGVELEGTEVEITKIMSTSPPRRIERLRIVMKMKANRTLTPEQKDTYEQIAKTCPVMLSLSDEIEKIMTFEWE